MKVTFLLPALETIQICKLYLFSHCFNACCQCLQCYYYSFQAESNYVFWLLFWHLSNFTLKALQPQLWFLFSPASLPVFFIGFFQYSCSLLSQCLSCRVLGPQSSLLTSFGLSTPTFLNHLMHCLWQHLGNCIGVSCGYLLLLKWQAVTFKTEKIVGQLFSGFPVQWWLIYVRPTYWKSIYFQNSIENSLQFPSVFPHRVGNIWSLCCWAITAGVTSRESDEPFL